MDLHEDTDFVLRLAMDEIANLRAKIAVLMQSQDALTQVRKASESLMRCACCNCSAWTEVEKALAAAEQENSKAESPVDEA